MARLPSIGSDDGIWGAVLNDFLSQSHNNDGSLRNNIVGTEQLRNNSVSTAKLLGLGSASGIASLNATGKLPDGQLPSHLTQASFSATVSDAVGTELAQTLLDVTRFGIKNDNTTDNTPALNALVASLPIVGADAKRTLYFPAGNYKFGGATVFDKTITIRGDGENATRFARISGATGDLFTFQGNLSTIRDISINGNGTQTTGDDIVFDAAYARAQNLYLTYSGGTAIRIGKNSHALLHRVDQILVRAPKDHAAWITNGPANGSTDGIWSNCDFGTAGLSAIRIESSSLNMTNMHVWGSGTRMDATDCAGFLVSTSGHLFTTCQAEKNWGHGFDFRNSNVNGALITGTSAWSNGLSGFSATNYHRLSLIGWSAYNNGLRNLNGATLSDIYAGVRNEGSNYLSLNGGQAFDRANAQTVTSPASEMSRGAYSTQVLDYAEAAGSTPIGGTFVGNSFPTPNGIVLQSSTQQWSGNAAASTPVSVVAASSLPIRSFHDVVTVSGSTLITSIANGFLGQTTMLTFTNSPTVNGNGNIILTAQFVATPGSHLTLRYDGSNWIEIARHVA